MYAGCAKTKVKPKQFSEGVWKSVSDLAWKMLGGLGQGWGNLSLNRSRREKRLSMKIPLHQRKMAVGMYADNSENNTSGWSQNM